MLSALVNRLADMEFHSPPLLEITGSINLGSEQFQPDMIGHAAFGQFTYKKVPFSELSADFSWDGERTFVRELRVRHQTGQLRADLFDAPNDFRLNLESTISPEAVRPLVPTSKRVSAGMAVATFACNSDVNPRHRSQSRRVGRATAQLIWGAPGFAEHG